MKDEVRFLRRELGFAKDDLAIAQATIDLLNEALSRERRVSYLLAKVAAQAHPYLMDDAARTGRTKYPDPSEVEVVKMLHWAEEEA